MRNLLFFLVLLLVCVAGLGFYLEWFKFSSSRDPETGRVGGQLSFDKEKMKSDVEKAKQKLGSPSSQAKEQENGN